MDRIINVLWERCQEGLGSILVTLVNDSKNTPRGMGAAMVVGEKGLLAGTIGGGMLEYTAISRAEENLKGQAGELYHYGLKLDSAAQLGMVCGGEVDALFTYVEASAENGLVLSAMARTVAKHEQGWLVLPMNGRAPGFWQASSWQGRSLALPGKRVTAVKHEAVLAEPAGRFYVQALQQGSHVYIFGGGHLGQELVPLLNHLGFRCIVTDDRPEFSRKELFPAAEAVFHRDFSHLDGQYEVRREDYIISVTRGHKGDFDVEKFALKTPASYIGCVGSRPKVAFVNEKLRQAGFTEQDIGRITAPIGLDIGSETPAEIAVSIAAQLILHRSQTGKD